MKKKLKPSPYPVLTSDITFHYSDAALSQIAKALESTSIRYRSDANMSDRCRFQRLCYLGCPLIKGQHCSGVLMVAMASQTTSLTIVYSTAHSGADQRKHQSSVSLAFVRGIHRWPVNSLHKWPVTRKMFPFDDVIMQGIGSMCTGMPRHYHRVI